MARVFAFGLSIDSAFDVPGSLPCDAPPDIVIGEGQARLDNAERLSGPYACAGDRMLFTVDCVARYLCIDKDRIIVEPASGADREHVEALLIATALPALLWMRGHYLLHAAAFLPEGHRSALAVTAPSGGGKSTLLAEAVARGAVVLADDVLSIDTSGARLNGAGLPAGYFVAEVGGGRTFVPAARDSALKGAPVGTLITLLRGGAGAPRLERLRGVDAIEIVLAARHRPTVPKLMSNPSHHMAQTGLLARELAIYRLHAGKAGPAAIVDTILQEFAQ